MTIAIFLILYAAALLIFVVFSGFIYYHLFRFGFRSRVVYFMNTFYACVAIALIAVSLIFIFQIDWSTPISLVFPTPFNTTLP